MYCYFIRRFREHLAQLYGKPTLRSLTFSLLVAGSLSLALIGGFVFVAIRLSQLGL